MFTGGAAPRFPLIQLLGRALRRLRKTAESQTISYVLWLATFHCPEAPSCLFLLGFFLASPIASSLPPVMLQWATWGGGDLCSPLHGDSLRDVWGASPFAAQERHGRQGGIDQWLFTNEPAFFFFCCLCHPIIESRSEPEHKQTNKSGRARIKMWTVHALVWTWWNSHFHPESKKNELSPFWLGVEMLRVQPILQYRHGNDI